MPSAHQRSPLLKENAGKNSAASEDADLSLLPCTSLRLQLQPWMDDGEDGEDRRRQAAEPHKTWAGLVETQPVQGDENVTGVFHHVQEQRWVVPQHVCQEAELKPQPQGQLLELAVFPGCGAVVPAPLLALPVHLTLHQQPDFIGVPAQVHYQGEEVVSGKDEGRELLSNIREGLATTVDYGY